MKKEVKRKRYWLRGGIVLSVVVIIILLISINFQISLGLKSKPKYPFFAMIFALFLVLPAIILSFIMLILSNIGFVIPKSIFPILTFLITAIFWFIIGAIIGYIYGKVKQRK